MEHQVIILGGGPAGISALLWCHSLGLQAILLEQGKELGGQMLQMFHPVLEYPGFPDKTGVELRDEFERHLRTYNLRYRVNCHLEEINLRDRRLLVNGEMLSAQAFIIATGAQNRRLGLANEETLPGISYSATHDQQKFAGQEVVVVGGGDSAFEDSLILAEVCPRVMLLHRSDKFRARPSWQQAVFTHPRIQVMTNCEIKEASSLADNQLQLLVVNRTTARQQTMQAHGLFVRLGIAPNTAFLQQQITVDVAGFVVVDRAQKTSLPNVYAVGDVCRPVCFSVATAIGHGAIAAKDIAEMLRP
ncbi:MAG: NAD(P)/FAD-dependent oxidoreductase [Acidobacteria bacterium]|nr:NAD(P)/FAD-dependent oxidoreductase [Acidobacteriota bacterium]